MLPLLKGKLPLLSNLPLFLINLYYLIEFYQTKSAGCLISTGRLINAGCFQLYFFVGSKYDNFLEFKGQNILFKKTHIFTHNNFDIICFLEAPCTFYLIELYQGFIREKRRALNNHRALLATLLFFWGGGKLDQNGKYIIFLFFFLKKTCYIGIDVCDL